MDRSKKLRFNRRVSPQHQKLILSIVRKHPEYSSKKIAKVLPKDKSGKSLVSNHGVQNVLSRLDLSVYGKRQQYSQGRRHIPTFGKLRAQDKLTIIRRVEEGARVAEVCRQYGISRTLFYRFFRRYRNALQSGEASRQQILARLGDQAPVPHHFWRLTSPEIEKKVLEIVAEYPGLSAHKIVEVLPQAAGRPILSNKGVQNVLRRHNLSTFEQRLAYSRLAEKAWKPRWTVADIPTVPLHIWRMLYAPFATIPKLEWLVTRGQLLLLFIFVVGFYSFQLISAIAQGQTGPRIGIFFASVSLTFGIFFFLYSLKYYLSILLVLRLAQSGAVAPGNSKFKVQSSKFNEFLAKIFNFKLRETVNPLNINLDRVKLDSQKQPFVSIHLAVYNEKRVIERLIRACTSQEWPNYELIIVDDSTDETTEIAKQLLIDNRWKLSSSNVIARSPSTSLGMTKQSDTVQVTNDPVSLHSDTGSEEVREQIFTFTKPDTPTVKLIHRSSRFGFKGGALQEALRASSPQAEYICVFDADFIPYPDTIEQFIKTFQVLGTGISGQGLGARGANLDSRPYTLDADSNIAAVQGYHPTSPEASRDKVAFGGSNIAAVQGYQWHVLNKSQTWVTRGVRTEYAGSYVIERSGAELYGGLKQIAGAVYAIRADVLRAFGWGTSITEDFELTLRLYEAGYKVAFTPYIQAPAEAVSTIRRLIRQRMRWAEGASFNVKVMFKRMLFGRWEEASQISNYSNYSNYSNQAPSPNDQIRHSGIGNSLGQLGIRSIRNSKEGKVWVPSRLTLAEKLEFAYLAPYYLQAAFLVIGTLSWFLAEAILGARLPFWTVALGWSLVLTNLFSLPLMNIIGLFLEESDERDYIGILSFIALSYIVVPFQAYAAVKGFLERSEGPWFRTPKTGTITDVFERVGFRKFFGQLLGPRPAGAGVVQSSKFKVQSYPQLAYASAFNHLQGNNFRIRPRRQVRWVGKALLVFLLTLTTTIYAFSKGVPVAEATQYTDPFYLYNDTTALLTNAWQLVNTTTPDTLDSTTNTTPGQNQTGTWQYYPGTGNTSSGTLCSSNPNGRGWIWTTAFEQGGTINSGQWTFYVYESDTAKQPVGNIEVCVYKVTLSGGSISTSSLLFNSDSPNDSAFETDILDLAVTSQTITTTNSIGPFTFNLNEYLYVEYWVNQTAGWGGGTSTSTFSTGNTTGTTDPRIVVPTLTIPENVVFLIAAAPFIPLIVLWMRRRKALQLTIDN